MNTTFLLWLDTVGSNHPAATILGYHGLHVTTTGSGPMEPAGASDHRSALLAGYLGWTLDAFDFFLVVMFLTAIGREFHQPDSVMALATVVTVAFRPVGGVLFGLHAGRYRAQRPLFVGLV